MLYKTRGELDRAEQMLRRAPGIDEKIGHLEGMANTYANLGVIHKTRGDLKQAREFGTKARDLFARIGMPHMVGEVRAWLDGLPSPPPA